MRVFCVSILLLALSIISLLSGNLQNTTPDHFQQISIVITYGDAYGSGTIFRVGEENFIITCSHIITSARKVKNNKVYFDEILAFQEIYDGYRIVGRKYYYANVVRYSPPEIEDICVLKLTNSTKITNPVVFGIVPPTLGESVVAVGSPLGQKCSNSVLNGNYAAYGRMIDGNYFDQVQIAGGHGGISGGGCFSPDGRYFGMFARKAENGVLFIIPSRRINNYLNRVGMGFVTNQYVPYDSEYNKIPIEEK